MPSDEELATIERALQLLAIPQEGLVKYYLSLRFLASAPDRIYAECPRECAAVVQAAFENGAGWKEVAQAARIDVAEAQRRWGAVEPKDHRRRRRRKKAGL
jgi:hypothetical protein